MPRLLAALLVAGLLLAGRPAAARTAKPPPSPFQISVIGDAALLGGAVMLWVSSTLIGLPQPARACDPCSPRALSGLDRPVLHFRRSEAAARVSDVMVIGVPALAMVGAGLLDRPRWGWDGAGEDLLLIAQAVALAGSLQQLTALIVRRPRPYMYRPGDEADRDTLDAHSSFFSGHTTATFAAAAAFATVFSLRRPRDDLGPLVWLGSLLLATVVPICRVAGGRHFWSDVLVGAATGTAAGVLVPLMHRRVGRSRMGLGGLGLWARFD